MKGKRKEEKKKIYRHERNEKIERKTKWKKNARQEKWVTEMLIIEHAAGRPHAHHANEGQRAQKRLEISL